MASRVQHSAKLLMILLCCAVIALTLPSQSAKAGSGATQDYVHNVYPFLGVDWGGSAFVGAAVPFGMVKLGPDMESFDGRQSSFGYLSGGRILGFSHLHLSGASGKYGNILVAPVTGALDPANIKSINIQGVDHKIIENTKSTVILCYSKSLLKKMNKFFFKKKINDTEISDNSDDNNGENSDNGGDSEDSDNGNKFYGQNKTNEYDVVLRN